MEQHETAGTFLPGSGFAQLFHKHYDLWSMIYVEELEVAPLSSRTVRILRGKPEGFQGFGLVGFLMNQ